MDLPWNPALLEQRIARIHRMGQKRPVQIVNFVAKGTIEEGMLSVLAFKRSLSAGMLDGGSGEISLGGSRLNRFMKEVENVTGRMGEGEAMTPAEEAVGAQTAAEIPPVREEETEAKSALTRRRAKHRRKSTPIPGLPWHRLAPSWSPHWWRRTIRPPRRIHGSSGIRRPAYATSRCRCRRPTRQDGLPMRSRRWRAPCAARCDGCLFRM